MLARSGDGDDESSDDDQVAELAWHGAYGDC